MVVKEVLVVFRVVKVVISANLTTTTTTTTTTTNIRGLYHQYFNYN